MSIYIASEKTGKVREVVTRIDGSCYDGSTSYTWDDFKIPMGGRFGESNYRNMYLLVHNEEPDFRFYRVPFFRDEEFVFPVDTTHIKTIFEFLKVARIDCRAIAPAIKTLGNQAHIDTTDLI